MKRALQQFGFSKEALEDLKYSEIGALVNELLGQLYEERNQRLALEAYIDINEKATTFLRECYPKWGSYRHLKNTTEEYWKVVFCNLEEPRVVGLKTFLKENNLSEEKFIAALNSKLISKRNDMSHRKLSPNEKPPAYESLKRLNAPEVGVALTAMLYVAIGNITTVVRNSTLMDEVYHQMK
ncbi:hypothetical protein U1Q18_051332, partial [Sarracenia purpurea var. burkii]